MVSGSPVPTGARIVAIVQSNVVDSSDDIKRRRSATFGSRFSSRRVDRAERSKAIIASASSAELVKDLASKFEIPGHVEFKEGRGGLPTVVLKHACGSSAEVTLFGGCVTSWKQASGDEVLYIRPDAVFDKSKPISGGIPHCFPQFGPGEMQQHGFARNLDWEVVGSSADPQPDDRDPEIEIALIDNEYTKKMWPHDFMVAYSISLHGETLKTDMRVLNKGSEAFDFTAALHSYFEVAGVENAKVNGLKGLVRCSTKPCLFTKSYLMGECFLLVGVPGQDGGCQQPSQEGRR